MKRTVSLLIAAALAAPGLAAGVALHLAPDGTLDQRLTRGRPAAVELHPSTPLMVWAKTAEDVSCQIPPDRPGGSSTIENALIFDRYVLHADGQRWYGALAVVASPAGTYQITCTGPSDLAVGAAPWSYGPRHSGLLRMATLGFPLSDTALGVLVALTGLPAAAVVLLAGRRRRAKTAGAPGTPR
jgi:hypothetical protein